MNLSSEALRSGMWYLEGRDHFLLCSILSKRHLQIVLKIFSCSVLFICGRATGLFCIAVAFCHVPLLSCSDCLLKGKSLSSSHVPLGMEVFHGVFILGREIKFNRITFGFKVVLTASEAFPGLHRP